MRQVHRALQRRPAIRDSNQGRIALCPFVDTWNPLDCQHMMVRHLADAKALAGRIPVGLIFKDLAHKFEHKSTLPPPLCPALCCCFSRVPKNSQCCPPSYGNVVWQRSDGTILLSCRGSLFVPVPSFFSHRGTSHRRWLDLILHHSEFTASNDSLSRAPGESKSPPRSPSSEHLHLHGEALERGGGHVAETCCDHLVARYGRCSS